MITVHPMTISLATRDVMSGVVLNFWRCSKHHQPSTPPLMAIIRSVGLVRQLLLEPVMGVRLVIERVDLAVAR